MKKVLILIFSLFSFISTIKADELVNSARSAVLMEASTGRVLYEKNSNEALPPASMTKIMTLLLTMEAIEKGQIGLEDKVQVSENAASMGGSQVFLEPNSEYTLDEIIKAVCIASGNDAAVVLAEAIGGSTSNFVQMMNKRAKELGLTSTNFVNVYGLDADGHLSSARDMAVIARELIKHELILQYSSIYEEYLQKKDGTSTWMVNTNNLVKFYKGIDGLKTGYTGKALYCLTATGKWKGMRLISVVMGEPTKEERTKDTIALLNYGKNTYRINTIVEAGKSLGTVNIDLGEKNKVDVVISEEVSDLVGINDLDNKYTYKMDFESVKAPIKKGKKVGVLTVFIDGKEFTKRDLVTKNAVNKCSIWEVMKRVFKTLIVGSRFV